MERYTHFSLGKYSERRAGADQSDAIALDRNRRLLGSTSIGANRGVLGDEQDLRPRRFSRLTVTSSPKAARRRSGPSALRPSCARRGGRRPGCRRPACSARARAAGSRRAARTARDRPASAPRCARRRGSGGPRPRGPPAAAPCTGTPGMSSGAGRATRRPGSRSRPFSRARAVVLGRARREKPRPAAISARVGGMPVASRWPRIQSRICCCRAVSGAWHGAINSTALGRGSGRRRSATVWICGTGL